MKKRFDPELYNVDTMPNGDSNRCKAITQRGRGAQCKNPVFHGQIGHETWEVVGFVEGYPAYKSLVEITDEEYDTMIAGVCYIHSEFDN